MLVNLVLAALIGSFVVGPAVGWILGQGLLLIATLLDLPAAPAQPAELPKPIPARPLSASELLEYELSEEEEEKWWRQR